MEDSNSKQNQSPTPRDKNTLSKFIEYNQKLISVLGVFTALTVFTAAMPLRAAGYALSFIFLSLTLIIWTELLEKFPKGTGTWRLTMFENLLFFSALGLFLYWLLAYREIWHSVMVIFLTIILAIVLTSIVTYPIKKYDLFDRLLRTKAGGLKVLRYVLFLIIVSLTFGVSLKISSVIAPPFNEVLDRVHEQIDKMSTP